MIAAFPCATHNTYPVKIHISTLRRNEYSPLAQIKSLAYLDNILARREAVKLGFDEAILLNTQGNIAEASAANLFMVTKDNILTTPNLKDGVLPGITREIVLTLADALGISKIERSIHPDELFDAKEIFLTNSVIEVQPVSQIDHKVLTGENPMTSALQTAYHELIKKHLG